ncbi:MAG: hypothetical protein LCH54_16275 [Bacteroidetes bacterium]|nr:hypothetical protein [Bacteroidota bacterium]
MANETNPVNKKRKIRTAIFIVLTGLFTFYIFLFPELWIFASVMAALSAIGLIVNLRLK